MRRRRSLCFAAATLVLVSLSLSGCSLGGHAAACVGPPLKIKSKTELTISKAHSTTTLPPSNDNDAGDGRIPDHTPDADLDYNQWHHGCSLGK